MYWWYKIFILYPLKAKTLKLAQILAQYLYSTRRLDLPGIGTFLLDSTIVVDPESDKNSKKDFGEGISFENNQGIKDNPPLIDFISSQTGKIKALAAADLDSHLWLGQQFLNIGKPFMLDGIGSLVKTQSGQYSFSPGQLTPEILKEQPTKQIGYTEVDNNTDVSDYKDILNPRKEKVQWKKPVAILLMLIGLVLAIWGGYIIYKNTKADANSTTTPATRTSGPSAQNDNDTATVQKGNITINPPVVAPAGNYKFVIETAGRERAFKRFKFLKELPTTIQMGTKDSVNFTLFFILPATAADTARIKDSLRISYTPKWSRAYIEQ